MAIIFTCKVCETRAGKTISRQAYDHGVVLIRCPGCDNLHLIADHLGYFEDGDWNVEKYLQELGEKVTAVTDGNLLELTPMDILGSKVPPKDSVEFRETEPTTVLERGKRATIPADGGGCGGGVHDHHHHHGKGGGCSGKCGGKGGCGGHKSHHHDSTGKGGGKGLKGGGE